MEVAGIPVRGRDLVQQRTSGAKAEIRRPLAREGSLPQLLEDVWPQ